MAKDYEATPKQTIAPITFVIEVTAERISQKGTFSGLKVQSVKAKDNTELSKLIKVASPFQSGGAMYLQVTALDALRFLKAKGEAGDTKKETLKLW